MGASESKPPASLPVPVGKVRICMAGLKLSHHTGRAREIAVRLAALRPDLFETWFYYDSSSNFYSFLGAKFETVPFPPHLKGHDSSPFVWLETAPNVVEPIGGRSHFCEWLLKNHSGIVEAAGGDFSRLVSTGPSLTEAFHNKDEWRMTAAVA